VEIGKKYGITVLPGTEVNTREEIHCLALFEDLLQAEVFQQYLEARMMRIPNRPGFFGPQYLVDEAENIVDEEENLLLAALDSSIEEVEAEVHRLGGLFIPAHINRMQNGIYSQLGFLPGGLQADALEIALTADAAGFLRDHPETETFPLITGSDAHTLDVLGMHHTEFYMERPGFREIRELVLEKKFQSIRIR
jgi:PHP family Zn ribbon phosphoesterase